MTYLYDRTKAFKGRPVDSPFGTKVMYLGCGYYRNISYIKNITIPASFRQPDYDQHESEGEDLRTTIFWEPNIETNVQVLDAYRLRPLTGKGAFKVIATAQGLY